jgi:hypothetical protein
MGRGAAPGRGGLLAAAAGGRALESARAAARGATVMVPLGRRAEAAAGTGGLSRARACAWPPRAPCPAPPRSPGSAPSRVERRRSLSGGAACAGGRGRGGVGARTAAAAGCARGRAQLFPPARRVGARAARRRRPPLPAPPPAPAPHLRCRTLPARWPLPRRRPSGGARLGEVSRCCAMICVGASPAPGALAPRGRTSVAPSTCARRPSSRRTARSARMLPLRAAVGRQALSRGGEAGDRGKAGRRPKRRSGVSAAGAACGGRGAGRLPGAAAAGSRGPALQRPAPVQQPRAGRHPPQRAARTGSYFIHAFPHTARAL